jgi:hypothetical protein
MTKGVSTITEKVSVIGNHKRAYLYVKSNFKDNVVFSSGSDRYIITLPESIVEIDANSNILDFRIHGTFDKIDEHKTNVLKEFEEVKTYVNWVYDSNMNTATVPVDATLSPVDEMYPWLNGETLDSYYRRYMDSRESVMILIGPPGTGKTSFVRGLLTSTESSANVTYDEAILGKDSLFSDFIEGSSNVLVIEDADLFLGTRSDGNNLMHRFLNVSEGLVSIKGKKIIFSTNLPSVKDIDPALMRRGRCFDVIHFNAMSKENADKLADKLGIKYNIEDGKDTYTVAEIFSGERQSENKPVRQKFGFSV